MIPERICFYKPVLDPAGNFLFGDRVILITREDRKTRDLGLIGKSVVAIRGVELNKADASHPTQKKIIAEAGDTDLHLIRYREENDVLVQQALKGIGLRNEGIFVIEAPSKRKPKTRRPRQKRNSIQSTHY